MPGTPSVVETGEGYWLVSGSGLMGGERSERVLRAAVAFEVTGQHRRADQPLLVLAGQYRAHRRNAPVVPITGRAMAAARRLGSRRREEVAWSEQTQFGIARQLGGPLTGTLRQIAAGEHL